MHYKITAAVTTEPVSLEEARLQCKVDSDDTTHDTLLTSLITAAGEYMEHYTGRGRAAQTIEVALDAFPCDDDPTIQLPLCPVASITSIKYTDTDGVEQTLAGSKYALSLYGLSRNVAPTYGNYWPSTQDIPDAVRIVAVVGYTAAPKAVKAAILLHIEIESPLNPLTPVERAMMEKARDSLLDTVKIWGW